MKIVNRTKYPTRTLRTIFCQVHNEIAKYEGRLPQWKWLVVTIEYTRGQCVWRGHAKVRGTRMVLRFQRGGISYASVAQAFGHELMHNYGYHRGNARSMERRDRKNGGSFAPIDHNNYPGVLKESAR